MFWEFEQLGEKNNILWGCEKKYINEIKITIECVNKDNISAWVMVRDCTASIPLYLLLEWYFFTQYVTRISE